MTNYKLLKVKPEEMYYRSLFLALVGFTSCLLNSCTKDLDLRPTDSIDRSK